jgi:hypothetical protein
MEDSGGSGILKKVHPCHFTGRLRLANESIVLPKRNLCSGALPSNSRWKREHGSQSDFIREECAKPFFWRSSETSRPTDNSERSQNRQKIRGCFAATELFAVTTA